MTRYILDTTVLIAFLCGDESVRRFVRDSFGQDDRLATTCVTIAEIEAGMRPQEREQVDALLRRISYAPTSREAALRAGRYQAEARAEGRQIETADALIAGTARALGAVLVTDNIKDFPMQDIRVIAHPTQTP